jgi:hypothetical protein
MNCQGKRRDGCPEPSEHTKQAADNEAENVVWVDIHGKILSFHYVTGYKLEYFPDRKQFWSYIMSMAESGYRFQ